MVDLRDIFPTSGHVQRLYCDDCGSLLDLAYATFDEVVSDVSIRVEGLPVLRCPKCGKDHLPDDSRFAIIQLHAQASKSGQRSTRVTRRKLTDQYGFTTVPFLYDPDDYKYIPGLKRPHDEGFLTPVFFNKQALLKYDTAPGYKLRFASATYGEIATQDGFSIDLPRFFGPSLV